MPEWMNSTVVVAIIGAVGLIIQNAVNRQGRKEEVTATERDNLIRGMGEELERLREDQRKDRSRLDWLEREFWAEQTYSHRLHRGLAQSVDWGPRMEQWAQGDRKHPYPRAPDWVSLRSLIDTPRPRRPPPPIDDEAT